MTEIPMAAAEQGKHRRVSKITDLAGTASCSACRPIQPKPNIGYFTCSCIPIETDALYFVTIQCHIINSLYSVSTFPDP